MDLPDIHEEKPEVAVSLKKVGIMGIKMPIGFVSFEDKPVMILPTFDIYIDLPANQKGIHSSRNYEVTAEVLGSYVGKTYKLENLCAAVSRELFRRHPHATRSEVKAYGEAVFERRTPQTDILTYEPCDISAKAIAKKNFDGSINVRKTVGVGVIGITACPCGEEILKEATRKELESSLKLSGEKLSEILNLLPIATHIQRSYGSIEVEIPEEVDIDAMTLVCIVEDAMSSSSCELLKRSDEVELIKRAIGNARFVEDCVRHMISNVVDIFQELPDDVSFTFRQRNEESIHKHDLVAERNATLGELRKELGS
ncbi:MAG: GTP cyclohydrolase I FolE2 [Nitrososphaeria archaeon]|nr:GTP cyclohydrolase I FolE2 [Nitrososphaeria archaeon]NIN51594.1 GTP cyclohydrolase I FolE2 [Nitrososphaeria archaeon]NIQ32079.1 GTP cyclohydrolase I FolE2 [Nitrososphaeria archaeon]